MIGNLSVAVQIRKLPSRFGKIADYEAFFNAIDQDYESEDAIFDGYFYKINTPKLKLFKRSRYGNGCDFKHEIIEHRGTICFVPTKGFCFVKGNKFLIGKNYQEQYFDFMKIEKRRSNIMTEDRIQPFFRANSINLGYYDGISVFPRSVTDRNNVLFLHNNHFCFFMEITRC